MTRNVVRWVGAALAVAASLSFTPLGCSGGRLGAAAGQGDAEMPEGIALEIRTCAAKHVQHLGSAQHTVSFDVKLASNGEVDSVALRASTLGDEGLEACIASALRSLSEGDLPMRQSYSHPQGPGAPEARALVGQVEALECLASPPCLLVVAFFVGAAYVAVQIYLHAAQSSTAKPKPQSTTTATPIATTVPVVGSEIERRCMDWQVECLENIYQPKWNRSKFGEKKDCGACFRECKNHAKGEWPDYKCPRSG